MLLAEDIALLLTDDTTGRKKTQYLEYVLAGALLIDLALAGNVRITEQGESVRRNRVVTVPEVAPPTDPLLVAALRTTESKPHWNASSLVPKLAKGLPKAVYERLVRAEILQRRENKVLGMFPLISWPALDTGPEQALLLRLDEVLLFGSEPDQQTAATIGLLAATSTLIPVVDRGRGIDRRSVKRRGKEIQQDYWAAKAAAEAIQAVQSTVAVAAAGGS